MCEIKGCQGKARARGLCAKHYMRLLRQGDPEKLGRPGRPPKHDPYTEMANLVGAGEWSRRTMARYAEASRILSDCSAPARKALLLLDRAAMLWVTEHPDDE
jgi:hypothetical protein